MRRTLLLILTFILTFTASGKGLSLRAVKSVDSLMQSGLSKGYYPGVSIAVGNRNGLLIEKYYGYRTDRQSGKVTSDDVYDIASLTKVVATTFAVMKLYDEHSIDITKNVGDYLFDYYGTPVHGISLMELLTHTSGLPYFPAYSMLVCNPTGEKILSSRQDSRLYPLQVDKGTYLCADPELDPLYVSRTPVEGYRQAGRDIFINPAIDTVITAKIVESYRDDLRGKYRYSDTNFYLLRRIVEKITGQSFDLYTAGLFGELGMNNTGFLPHQWKNEANIIPTEIDHLLQRGLVHGYTHDDLSATSGNVEGNAGLFSNIYDISKFCRMMLGNGVFEGRRILTEETVRKFTSSPLRKKGIFRGLGFDKRGSSSVLYGGYGHTGYTGTMLWIDPRRDIFMVFLSNRVHPTRLNNGLAASELRTKIWEIIID